MIGGLCGAEMTIWPMKPGAILAHVQPASLKISPKLIAAQSMMEYCQLMSALRCVTACAMGKIHIVTVHRPLVSSSLGLRKHQTCVVLLDVGNMAPALHNISEASSR